VATLVAEAAQPADVFAAVAEEVGRLLAVDAAAVRRYLTDDTAEILAQWSQSGEVIPVSLRAQPVRGTVTATVRETRRPARVDRYTEDAGVAAREIGIRSAVGVPITVEGELWGLIAVVSTSEEPPPPGTEERLAGFTELVATAIANAQAREELRTIADEQAALRRVATLVGADAPPPSVFATVAEEVGHLLKTDDALVVRFEPDESVTIVASWTAKGEPLQVGHRRHVEPGDGLTPLVRETGRPARIDSQTRYYSELGVESAVAAPITVEGRIWGVVGVALRGRKPAPPDTEERLAAFTSLVATAIANAESRAELVASRARIVAAADGARRHIERDLHDGAQQRLVSLAMQLRGAQAAMPPGLAAELDTFVVGLNGALDELRELARGIHPPILAKGGLGPALKALARRCAVPVEVALRTAGRLPEPIEIAGYYVVSEALTNATKHADATAITVTVEADVDDHVLRIAVRDDGVGGADFTHGTGLVGLKDRVEALSGRILLDSTPGAGTRLRAELPIPATKDSVTSSSALSPAPTVALVDDATPPA
jgi:signal transduction histidine kinase